MKFLTRARHPVGWYDDLGDTVVALDGALATVARPDLAFPNHDAEVMHGKRVARVVQEITLDEEKLNPDAP